MKIRHEAFVIANPKGEAILSRLTGIHQGQLSHYVTGKRNPSKQTIRRIDESIHSFARNLSQVQFV